MHSAVARLLNRTGLWPGARDVDFEIDKAWANSFPEYGAIFDQGSTRTVLTPAYRLTAVDLDEPRIVEGLRITNELLPRIQQSAESRSVRPVILIIPTKESVYANALKEKIQANPNYKKLVEMESRARAAITSVCSQNSIEYVDALPALAGAVKRGEQIYPSSTESHPNARGYSILAQVVQQALDPGSR